MGSTKGTGSVGLLVVVSLVLILMMLAGGCLKGGSNAGATAGPAAQTTGANEGDAATPSMAEQAAADLAEMTEELAGEDEEEAQEEGTEEEEEEPEDDPEDLDPRKAEEALPPGVTIPEPDPSIDVRALYQTKNCAACHGDTRQGTKDGPPLKGLDEYWEVNDLEKYLQSPAYYLEGNRRLVEIGRKYNKVMPPSHMTRPQRYAMAYWLLEVKPAAGEPDETSGSRRPLRPKHKTGGGVVR